MLSVLTGGLWVTQVHAFVKAHWMVHLSFVHFILYKFYLKKKTLKYWSIPPRAVNVKWARSLPQGHCHLPRHILILRPWPGGEAPPWPLYLFPLSPSIVCTEGVGTLLLFCHIPSPSYPGNVGTLWSHPRPGLGMLRKIMLIRNIGLLHLQGQASRLRRVLPFSAR